MTISHAGEACAADKMLKIRPEPVEALVYNMQNQSVMQHCCRNGNQQAKYSLQQSKMNEQKCLQKNTE
jgi:hypothetical protein